MNIFKRTFCRVFQTGFRLALPFLPYREPKILASVEEIAGEMQKLQIQKVLLVTDKFLRENGHTKTLETSLSAGGIEAFVYDSTRANPTVDNVEEALGIYKQNHCKGIIAFGGGSAIDCAKAVGARVVYPSRSFISLKGNLRIFRCLPPLFAVPTTAGTGSETTLTAVITDAKVKRKYTMNSFPLIPHYAVLDARVTYSLPKSMTATTGMDALTHAVEAYIGQSTTKRTRKLCEEAAMLVLDNIETAYNAPENYTARENMLHAAYKAGVAFSTSYVGYIHAVAHSLGGQYNTPHGLANSVLLPIGLEMYGEKIYKPLYQLALCTKVAAKSDSVEEGAKKFIAKIRALNSAMAIPETIDGIRKEDIKIMAKNADKEGNPLYPVPILMDRKELEVFYYKVGGADIEKN